MSDDEHKHVFYVALSLAPKSVTRNAHRSCKPWPPSSKDNPSSDVIESCKDIFKVCKVRFPHSHRKNLVQISYSRVCSCTEKRDYADIADKYFPCLRSVLNLQYAFSERLITIRFYLCLSAATRSVQLRSPQQILQIWLYTNPWNSIPSLNFWGSWHSLICTRAVCIYSALHEWLSIDTDRCGSKT